MVGESPIGYNQFEDGIWMMTALFESEGDVGQSQGAINCIINPIAEGIS